MLNFHRIQQLERKFMLFIEQIRASKVYFVIVPMVTQAQ